jgi:predicted Zn finger-like uncharacterized protein
MIIQCENCSRKFVIKDDDIPVAGRTVQCGYCSTSWHQAPISTPLKSIKSNLNENLSVDKIKASDGKNYRFLGSQWAELLPSGKTGLFAKKKIGKELDKLTGRKATKVFKKKIKKKKEFDPSSEIINSANQSPEIEKSKDGLGFFGYIFLIIIIAFSIIGFLKTFETDLLNYFPEAKFLFEYLETQLIYVAETVKNIIVLIKDLINSY